MYNMSPAPTFRKSDPDLTELQRFASKHGIESNCILWEDELGRLRVWTANIGAHQTGQSSLDYRLRDASHIRLHIVKLLEDLHQTLKHVKGLLDDDSLEITSDHSATSSDSDVSIAEDPAAELFELHEDLVCIIDCLYRTSMLVRRPARHDFLTERDPDNIARYEFWDIRHVKEKFPKADSKLHRSLGAAITQRRRYLAYRKRHHEKLGKQMEMTNDLSVGAPTDMSETVATEFEPQDELRHEVSSVAGFSQTSYAPSLTHGGAFTIPAPPKESRDGSPFECPYCFYIITVDSGRDWQHHLMGDILPYSCIFPDCPISNKLFDSRHEWYGHLQMEHKVFDPERGEIAESSRQIGVQDPSTSGPSICVFCEAPLRSSGEFERHVARHLQELALYVLPPADFDDEDEILDDPPHDDSLDEPTSIHQADSVEVSQSTTHQSVTPSNTGEQSSSGAVAEPAAPDTQEIKSGSEVVSNPSQLSTKDVAAPKWMETTFKMVIHLPETSKIRVAKLDTGADVNVMSKQVADSLGFKLQPYFGGDLLPSGGRITPLGQLTLDWHIMGKEETYTNTFVVVDAKEFDVVLGHKTIREIGFWTRNHKIW
ncbi:hypothetical protein G7Y79_00023g053740 [Physcia stellaris]|nr:hypothetical protein G7Y79_00023g053740 [Physcia stellaris]